MQQQRQETNLSRNYAAYIVVGTRLDVEGATACTDIAALQARLQGG